MSTPITVTSLILVFRLALNLINNLELSRPFFFIIHHMKSWHSSTFSTTQKFAGSHRQKDKQKDRQTKINTVYMALISDVFDIKLISIIAVVSIEIY